MSDLNRRFLTVITCMLVTPTGEDLEPPSLNKTLEALVAKSPLPDSGSSDLETKPGTVGVLLWLSELFDVTQYITNAFITT